MNLVEQKRKNNNYKKDDLLTAIVFLKDATKIPLKYRNISDKHGGKESFQKFVCGKWEVDHINYYTGLTRRFVEQIKIAQ